MWVHCIAPLPVPSIVSADLAVMGRRLLPHAVVPSTICTGALPLSPSPPPNCRYCGPECSHADWRAGHKRVCKALALAKTEKEQAQGQAQGQD